MPCRLSGFVPWQPSTTTRETPGKPERSRLNAHVMTDILDPEGRSRLMKRVKQKHTAPEMRVRSLLHRMGYRYSLHRKDLPGTPDIVFPRRRLAIFVHGCFWHGHDCRRGRLPKSNTGYWRPKIEANRSRDQRKQTGLESDGWRVVIVWQCELDDVESLTARLRSLLDVH